MKRKAWTVTPVFILYAIGILIMAGFSYRWNMYVFTIEVLIAVLSFLGVLIGVIRFNSHLRKTLRQAVEKIGSNHFDYLENFKIPVVITGEKNEIIWFNKCFGAVLGGGKDCSGDFVERYIPNSTPQNIIESSGADVVYGDKRYTVVG